MDLDPMLYIRLLWLKVKENLGMALYYIKYSTWKGRCVFLEDLMVSQQYRRYGIGSKLFDAVVEFAKKWVFVKWIGKY